VRPHDYAIYCPRLLFTNSLLPFTMKLRGRSSYKVFLEGCTVVLRFFYGGLNMEVLRITKDPFVGKVEARWRISGRPRLRAKER